MNEQILFVDDEPNILKLLDHTIDCLAGERKLFGDVGQAEGAGVVCNCFENCNGLLYGRICCGALYLTHAGIAAVLRSVLVTLWLN